MADSQVCSTRSLGRSAPLLLRAQPIQVEPTCTDSRGLQPTVGTLPTPCRQGADTIGSNRLLAGSNRLLAVSNRLCLPEIRLLPAQVGSQPLDSLHCTVWPGKRFEMYETTHNTKETY